MKYQRCKKCVMDTSDSIIQFDDEGICDHCWGFKKYYSDMGKYF